MPEMRVKVDNTTTDPVNVSGAVTVTPSGTQNVNLTGSSITVTTTPATNTSACYVFSIAAQPGVVAANNFLSLFNPVGSGKSIIVGASFISVVAIAATTTPDPMRGFRTTAASAGTLQAASTFAKFKTSDPTSIAEVRTGNPTVTLGSALFNVPPAITASGGSGGFTQDVAPPAGAPPLILAPGEGVVMRTNAGDTDQSWNLSIVWLEV